MSKQVLMYVPVIHAGYLALLADHQDADEVLILGESFKEQFPVLTKEIRALSPQLIAKYLRVTYRAQHIRVVEIKEFPGAIWASELVVPDEDIFRDWEALQSHQPTFVRTFLRWDREWSKAQRPVDTSIRVTGDQFSQRFLNLVRSQAQYSSDWWRQVGAAAVVDGQLLTTRYNQHMPTEYSPYINGDPRNSFKRGIEVELSTAAHAEMAIIAYCAKYGLPLDGAHLYVSTFPCPACARAVVQSGIAACYFADPYSLLDGEELLRSNGVELVWVDMENPPS